MHMDLKKAIHILATMQRNNYILVENANLTDDLKQKIVVYYILLATQIRYDVTGVVINPMYWYEINITDFENHKEEYAKHNNDIVRNLSLNRKMLAE